jgi:hypothetical protein
VVDEHATGALRANVVQCGEQAKALLQWRPPDVDFST